MFEVKEATKLALQEFSSRRPFSQCDKSDGFSIHDTVGMLLEITGDRGDLVERIRNEFLTEKPNEFLQIAPSCSR